MEIIDVVDLHHREYSADPPYTILEVYGVSLTATIELTLAGYGFDQFAQTGYGFHASRPETSPQME